MGAPDGKRAAFIPNAARLKRLGAAAHLKRLGAKHQKFQTFNYPLFLK
jgi:hypothetical protein